MGFNKRYIDKERIATTFSRLGIYGVRDLFGLPNGLTGLGRVDAIITQDEFSDNRWSVKTKMINILIYYTAFTIIVLLIRSYVNKRK